jgi:5-methylcytosine-specific restriction endonuclease McrA
MYAADGQMGPVLGIGSGALSGAGFGSVAEALRVGAEFADFLNSPATAAEFDGLACGEVLSALGEIQGKLAAAYAGFLRRFDAAGGHTTDGYGSTSAWLAARGQLTKKDARTAVREMRRLGERPRLEAAVKDGAITRSWALAVADWTRKLPPQLREDTDQILLEAAAAGASLDDLATIAGCAIESWRRQQPDHPDPDDGFDDRYLQVGVTFGGAAVIRGNLTPECAAAVRAVTEALGKRAGPEDDRTEGKRFHDALQLACELLLRARLVPDRAGTDTQVIAHIPLSQLRELPGAPDLEDAWIRARLGEDGYLTGKDAQAAACDAQTVPVVTGTLDPTVIDQMIDLARTAAEATASDSGPGTDGQATECHEDEAPGQVSPGYDGRELSGPEPGGPRSRALSPEAWRALRHAMARLAVDLVSGPAGAAATLRQGLLAQPYNTPSLPLDIGYSDTIPWHIRRAVLLRDKKCAWPKCGRPAVYCDVHHLRHKEDGGETTLDNLVLVCQFHHDVCIHRKGWQLTLHPDGTTEARSPDGKQILYSHAPPGQNAA